MLRFRLGSVPVEVHPSHLFTSALIGLMGTQGSMAGAAVAFEVVSWIGVVFLSVLVHELGHALVSLAFGYRPSISLVALGGLTNPNAPGPIPWHKDVLLTLAGPTFGFGLAAVAFALLQLAPPEGAAAAVLRHLLLANLFWSAMNLLPVSPLDGGRISSAILSRAFGRRGFMGAHVLALCVSALVVLAAVKLGWLFLAIFFGLYGFRALTLLSAALKGETPTGPPDPHELAFAQAAALFGEGKLDEAGRVAQRAAETSALSTRARAHHLLGWISLKQAKGRQALDYFSQVQGQPVEPQALAAAFSLVGDETRALPLWELAWRQTKSSTVLHEYAGALVRLGRVDEALRLPGVDPGSAYQCAERVLALREDFAAAAQLGEAALAHTPRAEIAYDAACSHARAGNRADALRLLWKAHELGFTSADFAETDSDLSSLNGHPEFVHYLSALRKSARS